MEEIKQIVKKNLKIPKGQLHQTHNKHRNMYLWDLSSRKIIICKLIPQMHFLHRTSKTTCKIIYKINRSYYIQINALSFPYQPGHHPEIIISAIDCVSGWYRSRDDSRGNIKWLTMGFFLNERTFLSHLSSKGEVLRWEMTEKRPRVLKKHL